MRWNFVSDTHSSGKAGKQIAKIIRSRLKKKNTFYLFFNKCLLILSIIDNEKFLRKIYFENDLFDFLKYPIVF